MNNKKTLGRPAGSLNAPIAAFTMAVLLCSYCIASIRTARRESQSTYTPASQREKSETRQQQQLSWVHQALEEQREVEQRRKS
ncbi:uncharacterized protein EURHEDRAFT_409159 [Aspergillus ruber CBS 135680]|uniref:Uncharacterized protein n=1 Tax=Aspergillus ruber (strain CBS 135680) TaxID=1388766 RepID=A0A017SM61_ASPRC|nr:uncharacterized protein EURHEDRAFT_409159 [Aspergillus ruber CBS 135680]EYE97876.1 hypothetical protein EURHEDRAFT_409159 [Aspergillus ruber CBS 135680]